jgi:hypothetical protein
VRDDFVAVLTRNRAVEEKGPMRWLGHWFAPRSLAALPTVEFAQRLAETNVGTTLLSAGASQLDAAVDDLARQFERFGGDARAYFQQRAKALSISVAVAVAFALNVDAIRLFTSLLVDPQVTAKLIEYGKTITPPPLPVASAGAGSGAHEPREGEPAAESARAAGDAATRDVREAAATAMAFNLPIGLAYFPWCHAAGADRACALYAQAHRAGNSKIIATLWGRWIVFTLLSGLLIGLGGPFWYDTFVRLSGMVQGVRTVVGGGGQAPAAESRPTAPFVAPPATPAEAFRSAVPPALRPPIDR